MRFAQKNMLFNHVFDSFSLLFPFLCPRANCFHRSSLRCSFLKSDVSNSLTVTVSLKSDRERFALGKERIEAFSLFHSQKTSDSHKKPKSEFPALRKNYSRYFFLLFSVLSFCASIWLFKKRKCPPLMFVWLSDCNTCLYVS